MEAWREELYHHGILGMKWGKKNGPPYPLGDGDHSSSEKKEGWKKSLGGGRNEDKYDRKKKDPNKTPSAKIQNQKKRESDAEHNRQVEEHKKYLQQLSPEDRERAAKIAKGILITAAVVGTTAAVAYVYKNHGAEIADALSKKNGAKNLADLMNKDPNKAKDIAKQALTQAAQDVANAYPPGAQVLKAGETLHRQVGVENYDLKKAGDFLFAAFNETDVETYKSILADTNAEKKRWDVELKAVKDIVAPSDQEASKIINDLFANDPDFEKDVRQDIIDMVMGRGGSRMMGEMNADIYLRRTDKTYPTILAFGTQGKASKKVIDEFSKKGYNAVKDYHDVIDGLTKEPLIVFDPDKNLQKIGEKAVSLAEREDIAKKGINDPKYTAMAKAQFEAVLRMNYFKK